MHWPIEPVGTDALVIRFSEVIQRNNIALIQAVEQHLKTHLTLAIRDWVPAYTTLTLYFDVGKINFKTLCREIENLLENFTENLTVLPTRRITIPVYYGPEVGLDLSRVAQFHNRSIESIIELHSQTIYQVYTLGFAPGFAYLGDVVEALRTPRLATPRQRVPAGSVAIADKQTAIYPLETPGGWHILGRTTCPLFDHQQAEPLLQTGDIVQFVPIGKDEFIHAGGTLR